MGTGSPLIGKRINHKFLALLGVIMGLREISMTMLNPFISIFGRQLVHSNSFLAGLALGIYGLTNSFFQIPYGVWSDKAGRKKLMILGLIQLFFGLLLAGLTSNIYVFIFARALQGSGAIMGIAYSWVGDITPVEINNRAMGFVGMIVAPSAVVAFIAGPILYQWISLKWMFLGAAGLIGLSLWMMVFFAKENSVSPAVSANPWILFGRTAKNRNLLLISFLGVIYNFIMASLFFVLPDQFAHYMGIGNLWMVFAPALAIGVMIMRLGTRDADAGHFKRVAFFSLFLLGAGFMLLRLPFFFAIWASAICVMSGYMCMTTILPSFINGLFPAERRGSANGILQTFTFLGFFLGPTVCGLFIQQGCPVLIYVSVAFLAVLGIFLLLFIRKTQKEGQFTERESSKNSC
ncbi:MFS transporter [Sporolactobacillus pectinivorans]|uniref:MFS transporter n=1 Tax=Sporolactobacillus pectinivorans TaxID=1591408 RepID=UPI0012FE7381|nr:MFS transporter [Sporolactobacillus pectinivorans]